MFWTRRNGHLNDEELSAYIDGELNAARLQAAATHLASCDDCTAALDGLREVCVLVSRLPELEPSRSFVLTPSMVNAEAGIGQHRPQTPPKRRSFVFVPAVALTLLVALFAVDLASSGTSSTTSGDEAATASQAMIAKDASSNAEAADSGGGAGAADAPLRSTFSAPVEPTPQAGQAAPVAPNVVPPGTGPASTPSSLEQQPAQAPAPSTSGPVSGAPVPVPSTKPSTESATAPAPGTPPDAPAITGGVASEAVPAPAPAEIANDSIGDGDGTSMRNRGGLDDGGTDWLRIAQALTAVVFVASLAYVFGSGLIKKGR